MSPRIVSTPSFVSSGYAPRARTRTVSPRAVSARTRAAPRKPPPPVTSAFTSLPWRRDSAQQASFSRSILALWPRVDREDTRVDAEVVRPRPSPRAWPRAPRARRRSVASVSAVRPRSRSTSNTGRLRRRARRHRRAQSVAPRVRVQDLLHRHREERAAARLDAVALSAAHPEAPFRRRTLRRRPCGERRRRRLRSSRARVASGRA